MILVIHGNGNGKHVCKHGRNMYEHDRNYEHTNINIDE